MSIEDRIQETLIYAYKKFWSDDAESALMAGQVLEGFLITLAKYEVRGHLKHHGKRPTQHLSSTDAIDLALADDPPISDSQLAETIRIMLRGRELMPERSSHSLASWATCSGVMARVMPWKPPSNRSRTWSDASRGVTTSSGWRTRKLVNSLAVLPLMLRRSSGRLGTT